MADDILTRADFIRYMEGFEQRVGGLEQRINQRMDVQFEETRGLIRLSLEAVDALRETTERGFAEMRTDHKEQIDLLKAAIKHIRHRVETIERRR